MSYRKTQHFEAARLRFGNYLLPRRLSNIRAIAQLRTHNLQTNSRVVDDLRRMTQCNDSEGSPTYGTFHFVLISFFFDTIKGLSPRHAFCKDMMTSSNGSIFRVAGPLGGKFTVTGEFASQRPLTRSFDIFFDMRLNKRLSKPSWCWYFETS